MVPGFEVCGGGLLQTDPQERAKTSTASSDCRPRPTAHWGGAKKGFWCVAKIVPFFLGDVHGCSAIGHVVVVVNKEGPNVSKAHSFRSVLKTVPGRQDALSQRLDPSKKTLTLQKKPCQGSFNCKIRSSARAHPARRHGVRQCSPCPRDWRAGPACMRRCIRGRGCARPASALSARIHSRRSERLAALSLQTPNSLDQCSCRARAPHCGPCAVRAGGG